MTVSGLKRYSESREIEDPCFRDHTMKGTRHSDFFRSSDQENRVNPSFRRPPFLEAFARWWIAGYTVSPLSGVYEDDDEGCNTRYTRERRGSHRRRWRSHRSLRIITSYPAFTF